MVQGVSPTSRKCANQAFRVNLPKIVHFAVNQQNGDLVPIEAAGILVEINVYFEEHSLTRGRRKLRQHRLHNTPRVVTKVAPLSSDESQCALQHCQLSYASSKMSASMTW